MKKEPKAVEVIQNKQGKWEVRGYWEGDVRSPGFDKPVEARVFAKKNGFIVCERPKKSVVYDPGDEEV